MDKTSGAQPGSRGLSAGTVPSGLMRMILPRSFAGCSQLVALACRHEQRTVARPHETRAEVKCAVGGGLLPEDHLHVFEVGAAIAVRHEPGARDARSVLRRSARLAIGQVDRPALGEVRRKQNVEEAALPDRAATLGQTLQYRSRKFAILRNEAHPPDALGDDHARRNCSPQGCSSPLAKLST
jgi:hypothetical protein